MTTIRELYEWAVENHVEDLPMGLQYQYTCPKCGESLTSTICYPCTEYENL